MKLALEILAWMAVGWVTLGIAAAAYVLYRLYKGWN